MPSGIAALIVATVPVWILLLDGLRPNGRPWTRARVDRRRDRAGGGASSRGRRATSTRSTGSRSWRSRSRACRGRSARSTRSRCRARLPLASAAAVEMVAAGVLILLASSGSWARTVGGCRAPRRGRGWASRYLAVFGSLVGFTAFAYCLNELPASTVGTYAYVNPVVAVVLGRLVLGEPLSPGRLVGGVLILVAVVLTTLRRPARRGGAVSEDLSVEQVLLARRRNAAVSRAHPRCEAPRRDALLDGPAESGRSRTGCRSAASRTRTRTAGRARRSARAPAAARGG